MIYKNGDFKNGYVLSRTSTDDEFQDILIEKQPVHCIICNKNTVKNFKQPLFSDHHITINNRLRDGVFFINGIY